MMSSSSLHLAERPKVVRNAGVASEKSGFIFETVLCSLHDCSVQIGAIAILLNEHSRLKEQSRLRSYRHLLNDDSKVMLLALSYGRELALDAAMVAPLQDLFRALGAAKRDLATSLGTEASTVAGKSDMQIRANVWRRLATQAAQCIQALQPIAKSRLDGVYEHDSQAMRLFLRNAADGDRGLLDAAGAVVLPNLKQRRSAPRLAVNQSCKVILPSGPHRARLEDVSVRGLALTTDAAVAIGDNVEVLLQDGRRLKATVARKQAGGIGVRLAAPLGSGDPLFAGKEGTSSRAR